MPVIWQSCLYVESAVPVGDLAELPVLVIWQNCLSVDSALPVADLAELPVCGGACQGFGKIACAIDLAAELSVCGHCASDLAELPVCGGV